MPLRETNLSEVLPNLGSALLGFRYERSTICYSYVALPGLNRAELDTISRVSATAHFGSVLFTQYLFQVQDYLALK